jgi:hypothetical protein
MGPANLGQQLQHSTPEFTKSSYKTNSCLLHVLVTGCGVSAAAWPSLCRAAAAAAAGMQISVHETY